MIQHCASRFDFEASGFKVRVKFERITFDQRLDHSICFLFLPRGDAIEGGGV
jgi:hypothetical protein